jgi:hypothetical protein
MTMQYDVKAAHLNESGFLLAPATRTRLKQITLAGNASQSGSLVFFDTATAPVTSGTYGRSGTTITVSSTGHGLSTGAYVGISFNSSSNVSATDGNYVITVTDANTFTMTDINSGTVTNAGTGCQYVSSASNATTQNKWVSTYETLTGATATQQLSVPGEGLLFQSGMYVYMNNMGFVTIHYG